MFHTHSFFSGSSSSKEQRLCCLDKPSETPILRSMQDSAMSAITHQAQLIISQNARHAESVRNMADIRLWTDAFRKNPAFFDPSTAVDSSALEDAYKPEDILKRIDANSRMEEWKNLVQKVLGSEVLHTQISYPETDTQKQCTVEEAMNSAAGRAIVMDALDLVMGAPQSAIDSASAQFAIARKSMEYRYGAKNRRVLTSEFSQFMDVQTKNMVTGPDDDTIFTPSLILQKLPPGQLRGAILLGHLGKNDLQTMLAEYRNQDRSKTQEKEKAHKNLLALRNGVERDAIISNGTTLLENFRSMHPAAKLGLGLGIAYLLKQAIESKNGFLRALPIGALGVYAYLRLIKGDQNALDTMGNATQNMVNFSANSLRDVGVNLGIMRPSDPKVDQFDEAVKFLDQKALLSIEDSAAAFTSIAQADLAILSDHFTMPTDVSDIPGSLNVDDQNSNLVKHLKIQLEKDGLRPSDQAKTIAYLISHQTEMSEALFNTWFYLGGREAKWSQKALYLEKKARIYGKNGFRKLNGQDRIDYMQIAARGHELAKSRYKGSSLLRVMQQLNEEEWRTGAQRWLGKGDVGKNAIPPTAPKPGPDVTPKPGPDVTPKPGPDVTPKPGL